MNFNMRLCENVAADLEWTYLVNETLEGEKCIVPLLKEISRDDIVLGAKELHETILGQIDEEVAHVRLYHGLVGTARVKGSGFREKLHNYVNSLQTVTLKLFALQGMLEGIALGALTHRLQNIENAPSRKVDEQALLDEQIHVGLSFAHFNYLKNAEGLHTRARFRDVTREVNGLFASSFNGDAVASIFRQSFGVEVAATEVENSRAMKMFRAQSRNTLIKNKNLFIEKYFAG